MGRTPPGIEFRGHCLFSHRANTWPLFPGPCGRGAFPPSARKPAGQVWFSRHPPSLGPRLYLQASPPPEPGGRLDLPALQGFESHRRTGCQGRGSAHPRDGGADPPPGPAGAAARVNHRPGRAGREGRQRLPAAGAGDAGPGSPGLSRPPTPRAWDAGTPGPGRARGGGRGGRSGPRRDPGVRPPRSPANLRGAGGVSVPGGSPPRPGPAALTDQ